MNTMRKLSTPNPQPPKPRGSMRDASLKVERWALKVEGLFSFQRRLASAALLAILVLALPLPAQTNAPRDLTSRYLFIVDTSAAMTRCAPAVQKTIGNLLRSSMSAQLHPGDTVGVWTFDEELHAGRFPLQRWSPALAELVASNLVAFLQTQKLQGKSRFDVIAPELERIVQESSKLTVLLVTDGDGKISGTPFDSEIQSSIAQHFKMQQKAHMPFVIVLRASRGQFIHATVNLAPWPVEFPAFPPELEVVETPKPKPPAPKPAEVKPVPRAIVPSLIVIGEKAISPPPSTAPTSAAPTALVKVETSGPPITLAPTPLNPAETKTPAPILAPTRNEPATQPATPSTKTPLPAAPPTALPETRPPAEPTTPPPAGVGETKPAPAPVNTPPAEPAPSPPAPSLIEPAPAPETLAVQPEPGFSRLGLMGLGGAVALLVGGCFLALQHRARNAAQSSIITRSFDRDRK